MRLFLKYFFGLALLFFSSSSMAQNLWGDINCDGQVDRLDVSALVDSYLNNEAPTTNTDLDGDNSLTIGDVSSLTFFLSVNMSSGSLNGHDYVDLGLPSGTLWATCNVGAIQANGIGEFYAWGEVETKDVYSWETNKWCNGTECNSTNHTLTKYCDRGGYGKIDGKISLEPNDDVAHVKWGGSWHIPTRAEFQELIDCCTTEWIKVSNNLHVYKFTGPNGNCIILPASGRMNDNSYSGDHIYYWSADLHMSDIPSNNHGNSADALNYGSNTQAEIVGNSRRFGYAIRPVWSEYTPVVHNITAPSSYAGHDLVDLGLPSGTLWATCNLGASSPEQSGCFYAWAETMGSCEGKTTFSQDNYDFFNGSDYTNYTVDGLTTLEPGNDAATCSWGEEWRMPTYSEITELINTKYTTNEWTTVNGVAGYRVTSIVQGFEGRSIFLPAAGEYRGSSLKDVNEKGYYWGSTLETFYEDSENANYLTLSSKRISKGSGMRYHGLSIRPVVSFNSIVH